MIDVESLAVIQSLDLDDFTDLKASFLAHQRNSFIHARTKLFIFVVLANRYHFGAQYFALQFEFFDEVTIGGLSAFKHGQVAIAIGVQYLYEF